MGTHKIAISDIELKSKIPPGSPNWPIFNASFVNHEIDAEHLMQAIWDGRSITPWHSNSWRHSKNYLLGQHLGLDFDSEDEHSRMKNLLSDKFISKYAALIHTTMSHTPEKPRARVIFLLDTPIMQPKNYVLAASALLWLYGTADRACRDAARLFYGSPNCEFEYLDNVLPIDVVKKIISQYQSSGLAEKKRSVDKNYRAPATQQEVANALKLIPPWGIEYDEWVEVLMGIHSEFGDAGYELAISWADGKPGEVEQKWRSFKSSGNTIGAVTIATVFGIAKNYGWKKGIDNGGLLGDA